MPCRWIQRCFEVIQMMRKKKQQTFSESMLNYEWCDCDVVLKQYFCHFFWTKLVVMLPIFRLLSISMFHALVYTLFCSMTLTFVLLIYFFTKNFFGELCCCRCYYLLTIGLLHYLNKHFWKQNACSIIQFFVINSTNGHTYLRHHLTNTLCQVLFFNCCKQKAKKKQKKR